VTGVKENL